MQLARAWRRAACLCVIAAAVAVSSAAEPESAERITPNFKDADIGQIAEAVSMATHKNFIIDPRVRAQVTMLSATPMSPEAFYQTFLAILQVHGFMAAPAGNVVKIIPDANARWMPGDDLPNRVSSTSDEFVTQVVQVKNVSAAQLVPVLRPLIPQQGHLAAYPASNILIISDRAANVSRLLHIIDRIDLASNSDVEVLAMQNASAQEIARVVTSLYQGAGQGEGGATPLKIVADDRSNSILLSGDPNQRLRVKALVAHLDTPLQFGGDTQVRYLRYADAEKLAPKLKEQITGSAQGGAGAAAAANAQQGEKNAQIWADPQNNALIITAPPKTMRSIMAIIDKLDIRRAQVLVEAIIVDVDLDKSSELGVNWAVFSESSTNTSIPGATFLTPVGGASLVDLANAIQNPGSLAGSPLATGTTVAVGRIAKTGLSFAAMLRALRSDDNSNVIATPEALTMDHQEATIKVAQEVPFVTGQYSNASTAVAGSVTPFQTIQREEVGTILKLTPQINGADAIVLKIDLESSSVVPKNDGPQGAVDLTTNKRTVSTNVLIEDGGIIVLGGLIDNEYARTENGVPLLSKIPFFGQFFKDRTASTTKKNLMIFIRPQILKDGTDTAIETNSKYNFIREEQRDVGSKELLPLLPGAQSPLLPALPPPPVKGSTPQAPVTPKEKENAASEGASKDDPTHSQAPPAGTVPPSAQPPPQGALQPNGSAGGSTAGDAAGHSTATTHAAPESHATAENPP
ncbi:MAG TPA: type II secretion system secretin GspD [Steroidobacteraceae bacterium]|nr:type II secretion system secretin GspD [Steroidobacteraceae bacterium]